jgi:hypothetical protein
MNADAPTPNVAECEQFMQFWTGVSDTHHITLVAILPDSQAVHARTFTDQSWGAACNWIADHQATGRNIYFQPNETPPNCARKPRKTDMVAATCRFADIDPDDEHYPLVEERHRLIQLADHLANDPTIAPTVIIDSGNGIQPIWAVTREPLDEVALARVESENREIEAALGAGGTHNIDRLLRVPGTVNYPNAAKRKLGRGISRARLIFPAELGEVQPAVAASNRPAAEDIEVGDLVQVAIADAFALEQPDQVRAIEIYEGRRWVFIRSSETGVPVEQIVLIRKGGHQADSLTRDNLSAAHRGQPNIYQPDQAATLAARVTEKLAGTGLVRPKHVKPTRTATAEEADVAALVAELEQVGADKVTQPKKLPAILRSRLYKTLGFRRRLAARWAGKVDDLTEAGRDATHSGVDLSLAAMLKAAGFSHLDAGLILCAFPHGKANNKEWPNPGLRLRHVARSVLRSHEPSPADTPEFVQEFNDKYMVVNENGKCVVYAPVFDPILRRRQFDRFTFDDLRRLYSNRLEIGSDRKGNSVLKNAATAWLEHPDRRQYINGVTFDPSGRSNYGTLNLWQGFAVKPVTGDWSLMKHHILDVICNKNLTLYSYLMCWLARMVQYPAQQGEVAVVMKGGEGTGKGTLARAMLRVLGQHSMHISNARHLVGNFNAHLRDCILLFADEAFFAGDKQHVGVLKALITELSLAIEAKYQNAVQAPNFVHIMMASNEEWVIPAGLDARRFLVLVVSEHRKGDHAYFAEIWKQMEAGGYEAMLYDLLNLDITTFNVRSVPVTEGLQQQKKLSLPTFEAWWLDVLHRGYVYRSRLGLEEYFGEWHDEVTTEVMYTSYINYAQRVRERHPLSREDFGKKIVSFGAKPTRPRDMVIGEHVTDVANQFGGTTRKSALIRHPRPPAYHLGGLEKARIAFMETTALEIDWQDPPEDTKEADRAGPSREPKWRLKL